MGNDSRSAWAHEAAAKVTPVVNRRRFLQMAGRSVGTMALGGVLVACADEPDAASGGTAGPTEDAGTDAPLGDDGAVDVATGAPTELEGQILTVRSTDVSWLWAPYLVADHQGFFAEEGLDQEGQPTGEGEVAGLVVSGNAEMIVGSPVGPMKTTVAGQPLISFAAMVTTYASNIVITGEAFQAAGLSDDSTVEERAAALRGLRIATTGAGAGPDLLVRYVASELGGLDPERDLTLTPIQGGGGPMLAAIENGQLDGFCLSSPTSDQGVTNFGMRYLFNMAEDPIRELENYLYIVASCTPEYLASNEAHVLAYCRALQRALNFIQEEPEAFKDVMRELFEGVEPEVFEAGFEGNRDIYGDTIVITQEQFEQAKEFLVVAFEVQDQPSGPAAALEFDDVMNSELAQRAVDQLS